MKRESQASSKETQRPALPAPSVSPSLDTDSEGLTIVARRLVPLSEESSRPLRGHEMPRSGRREKARSKSRIEMEQIAGRRDSDAAISVKRQIAPELSAR